MQQRLEGVGAAPSACWRARAAGKLPEVLGMIGDFVQTDLEHAPLVEAAPSGADQQLVVRYFDELRQARRQLAEILGDSASVEILCLDRLGSLSSDFDLSLCPQALARVVDFVRCDDWLAPAIWRMLGTTAVVKDLADAASAAAICPDGWRFVTLSGEVLEADGRVRLGAVNRSGGIVLRRSELADLQVRDVQLQKTIDELHERLRHHAIAAAAPGGTPSTSSAPRFTRPTPSASSATRCRAAPRAGGAARTRAAADCRGGRAPRRRDRLRHEAGTRGQGQGL